MSDHSLKIPIKGALIDIDGTLYFDRKPIPGAVEAIQFLRQSKIPFQFITNNDSHTPAMLAKTLTAEGISTTEEEITSTLDAGAAYIREMGGRVFPLLMADIAEEFTRLGKPEDPVKFVVVGDPRESLTFENINTALRFLLQGAELIALQPAGRFITDFGLQVDTGAVAAMLEYASDKKAILIGKPQPTLFQIALKKLAIDPSQVVVIGDDITADVAGAEALQMRSILVRTGMYPYIKTTNGFKPTLILDSIAELPGVIQLAR